MIGARMRQARLAAGMTLDAVSKALSELDYTVTKSALSKYERERSSPPASLLLKLGQVLGVEPGSFISSEPEVSITFDRFRKKSRLTKTRQEQLKAAVSERVRRYLTLVDLMGTELVQGPLPRKQVCTVEDAELAAEELRSSWGLGVAPIESVCQVLEDHGVIVLDQREAGDDFDGLSAEVQAPHRIPIIIYDPSKPQDRRRLNLAHELGHLIIDNPGEQDDKVHERLAMRFAASFLVPAASARKELGEFRHSLDARELKLLKQKYGLSMFAWIRRAFDLEIISKLQYTTWCRIFSARGWRSREPEDYQNPFEEPRRLRQLTLRALAERRISPGLAKRLCPDLPDDSDGGIGSTSLRSLLAMSREKRDAYLEMVAERAAADYAPGSDLLTEAFGEDDLIDETED